MNMICKNCVFYKRENVESIGNCHCHPPTNSHFWPEVYETDYCGEFANSIEIDLGGITTVFTIEEFSNQTTK